MRCKSNTTCTASPSTMVKVGWRSRCWGFEQWDEQQLSQISPDGRWIVFVKARNAQLMRPDSELYIVPAAGGAARKMRCNMSPMNSWHSFSPNGGDGLSSKRPVALHQMYLTHIDANGNDSPPILVEDSTAANRPSIFRVRKYRPEGSWIWLRQLRSFIA